jgi:hypothetical protein
MARVLFARVGWMKRYLGPTPDDPRPIGGGNYSEDHVGGEAWNFLPVEGRVFGYFETARRRGQRGPAHAPRHARTHRARLRRRAARWFPRSGWTKPRPRKPPGKAAAAKTGRPTVCPSISWTLHLGGVLVVFVATDPERGGQYIVGWFRDATVHRLVRARRAQARRRS